jgi:surface protein
MPDLSGVTDMSNMFSSATIFNESLNNWNVSNVTNMSSMFLNASAFNQPLDDWDVGNVTNFRSMFYNATAFNQPLSNWDVSSGVDMNSMFVNVASFNQPLNGWDVSNVTSLAYTFYGAAAFNQPLSNWNVGNVTVMINMFDGATAFNQGLGSWALNASVNMADMLINNGMDCNNYSSTLIGWAGNSATPSGRSLVATGKTFGPAASASRDYLINTKSWTIDGDSFDANCIVLPVTLVSFGATKQESSSLLTWSTTEETNSDRFEIQRSRDGKDWPQIGVLASSGESTVLKTYRFQDDVPLGGINYYRLKMVDRDKTFAYSRIQSVDFGSKSMVSIYPNPASDRLLLNDYNSVKSVKLYNMAGLNLLDITKITAQGIDISCLSPGLHTAKVTFFDGSTKTSKLVITK